MAMYWDVANIANHKVVTTDPSDPEKWHPITMALVNATMAVDLGRIEQKNLDEWFFRLAYLEEVGNGNFLIDWRDRDGKELEQPRNRNFKREEVESHIGLATNVSTMTRRQWLAKCQRILVREAEARVRHSFKAAETAKENAEFEAAVHAAVPGSKAG